MKKVNLLLIAIMIGSCVFAQSYDEVTTELKKGIGIKLRQLVESFDGVYEGGLSITEINDLGNDEAEIRGKVNYKGSLCGSVRAKYKVTIYSDGYMKTCILTPICSIFGGKMREEWDCSGKKWGDWKMTTKQIIEATEE